MTSHPQQKMGQLPEHRRKGDFGVSPLMLIIDLVKGNVLVEFVLPIISDFVIEKLVNYAVCINMPHKMQLNMCIYIETRGYIVGH